MLCTRSILTSSSFLIFKVQSFFKQIFQIFELLPAFHQNVFSLLWIKQTHPGVIHNTSCILKKKLLCEKKNLLWWQEVIKLVNISFGKNSLFLKKKTINISYIVIQFLRLLDFLKSWNLLYFNKIFRLKKKNFSQTLLRTSFVYFHIFYLDLLPFS